MLDAVDAEFETDSQRYYLLGVSNGAMMALRLGCNLSSRFAAVAPIIGQLAPGFACAPGVDLPMMHLFGGADNTVRYDGQPAGDGFIYTSAARTAQVWAQGMSCKTGPVAWSADVKGGSALRCTAYRDCAQPQQEVVSCMHPQGSHNWPGQGVAGMPATCVGPGQVESMPGQARCPDSAGAYSDWGMDLVWKFMSRYRR